MLVRSCKLSSKRRISGYGKYSGKDMNDSGKAQAVNLLQHETLQICCSTPAGDDDR
jgi:hypothetical protein